MHLPLLVQTSVQRSASAVPSPPFEQVENAVDDRWGIRRVGTKIDPGRLNHRACRDAFAAAGAGIENVTNPAVQGLDEGFSVSFCHCVAFIRNWLGNEPHSVNDP